MKNNFKSRALFWARLQLVVIWEAATVVFECWKPAVLFEVLTGIEL